MSFIVALSIALNLLILHDYAPQMDCLFLEFTTMYAHRVTKTVFTKNGAILSS